MCNGRVILDSLTHTIFGILSFPIFRRNTVDYPHTPQKKAAIK